MEYKYKLLEYKDNTFFHPKLEIIRGKIIKKLFNRFYKICSKYKPEIRKDKLETIMTIFCWANISHQNDPVVPFNPTNYNQLTTDLKNYGFDPKQILTELKLDKFFNHYKKKFDKIKQKLVNKYKKKDKKPKIKIIQTQDKYQLVYKRYKVDYTETIFNKLDKYYHDNHDNHKHALYFCILYRYQYLSGDNQQLAVLSSFKEDIRKHFNVDIELFGSCINRYASHYCSLFYDLERYFGSLGNFNNFTPIKGLYFANPPFDETIMTTMAKKLIKSLDESKESLGFIVNVPVWDYETQRKLDHNNNNNYGGYDCKDIIVKSKYFYKEYVFRKKDFPYFNFTTNKTITATNTYIFIIKNDLLSFDLKLFEKLLIKNNLHFIK